MAEAGCSSASWATTPRSLQHQPWPIISWPASNLCSETWKPTQRPARDWSPKLAEVLSDRGLGMLFVSTNHKPADRVDTLLLSRLRETPHGLLPCGPPAGWTFGYNLVTDGISTNPWSRGHKPVGSSG